jgi:outer membrane protein assembly factor BamB
MGLPLRIAGLRLSLICLAALILASPVAADWPQFRGVGSAGRANVSPPLPVEIGPDKNVIWKTELPPGHSSPVVVGDRIYVTAVRDKEQLLTIALDRETGKILWEQAAPHEKLEEIHSIGSHAQSSPTADGERVAVFFGSSGLFCYDKSGKLLWKHAMGPFANDFGAGSSPVLVDDRVLLCQDHDQGSFLAAYDKVTGKELWRVDRSREFARNYCTPVVWDDGGRRTVVVAGTLRVVGYDWQTGKEVWTVRGLSRVVCMTPVIGDDNALYVAGWSAGGDPGELIRLDAFEDVAAAADKNKDGVLEEAELPAGAVKQRFTQCDRNKDGKITREEYDEFRRMFAESKNVLLAINPGPKGDATETHVRWQFEKFVPFCSSPLYYQGHVFAVKDGGILSSIEAQSGKVAKTTRLPATGAYYSSAVAGDGKVYFSNRDGKATVVSAEGDWKVLSTADMGEETYATPALEDGRIYLRTVGALYCFGVKKAP